MNCVFYNIICAAFLQDVQILIFHNNIVNILGISNNWNMLNICLKTIFSVEFGILCSLFYYGTKENIWSCFQKPMNRIKRLVHSNYNKWFCYEFLQIYFCLKRHAKKKKKKKKKTRERKQTLKDSESRVDSFHLLLWNVDWWFEI